MLAAKYRFHGHGALKFLWGHGKTYRFKSMSVRVAHNPRREHSRVAIVISKKVIKASPKRNRVRRRVYEVLRTNWGHIKPAHDLIISIYDPKFLDLPADEMTAEIKRALESAKVWSDSPQVSSNTSQEPKSVS
ncbi:MAG: ribonuclease P protein component [Candidatus Saccharimonadales bacterium]